MADVPQFQDYQDRDTYKDIGFDSFIERRFPGTGLDEYAGTASGIGIVDDELGAGGAETEEQLNDLATKQELQEHAENGYKHGIDFVTNIAFTPTSYNALSYSAGNISYRDGKESVAINSGTVTGISSTTFIFYDPNGTRDELVTTTTYSEATTGERVLLAVAIAGNDTNGLVQIAVFGAGGGFAGYPLAGIEFLIDGGGSEISTGIAGDLVCPFNCTIKDVTMVADQAGSIVIDIWVDEYGNYPPDNSDSITASAPPTISAATKSQDTTLSGWTTNLNTGDIIRYNVDSVSTITRIIISMRVTKDFN